MELSEETKAVLEKDIGLPYGQIVELSSSEADAYVEGSIGKKLSFSKKFDPRKIVPNNPLLSCRRLRTMEEVDAGLDAICRKG